MIYDQYFPQGVAQADAFLGRQEETDKLLANINTGRHTLLLSPRRYGKTSLVRHALTQTNHPYIETDLFLAIDEKAIETRLLDGIQSLIQSFSEKPEQWLNTLINFFKKSNKKWTIGFKGVKLELQPNNNQDVAGNLLEVFNALEHILSHKKQRAVIFIDEFQELGKIKTGKTIEGAIRHFAQASKYLVFVFSGSNRHALIDIFGTRARPLYSLCDWVTLQRLTPQIYFTYLNHIANLTWKQSLPNDVLTAITDLTECHPEITYGFCANLWQYCISKQTPPSIDLIPNIWNSYVLERVKQTKLTLAEISAGQLKILILIATGTNIKLTGKEIQKKINLTSPTIVGALNTLEKEDFIEKINDGSYRIINPVIKATLTSYYSNYLDF